MKLPFCLLAAMSSLVSVLVVHAANSDDMLIYSDRFNKSWGDSWSWMPRYATNYPVGAALLARHHGIREHLNPN
jgi:hypothetical protein